MKALKHLTIMIIYHDLPSHYRSFVPQGEGFTVNQFKLLLKYLSFVNINVNNASFCRWEDSVDSVNGGNSAARSNIRSSGSAASNTNPGRNTGRGRGRGQGQGQGQIAATFVSAIGEPISDRRCFVCGDPSHFANVCPNRGA